MSVLTLYSSLGVVVLYPCGSAPQHALHQNAFCSVPFLKRIKSPIMLPLPSILWCWWLMIAAYSSFLSQAFPLLLLNVTLLFSFGAFVFDAFGGKQCSVDFIHCCFLFRVQSTFKGKGVNTCTPIFCPPFQISPRFPGVGDWGGLPHPECRLLSLFGSRINPG